MEHPSRYLAPTDSFADRHLGPRTNEIKDMLEALGYPSLDALADAVVPKNIRTTKPLALAEAKSEHEALREIELIARENEVFRSYIGMGYVNAVTPPVILRNILENPGWYTQYTPYQSEIAQGRLEALLNFQTMIADLTGLPIANASLLDEATAAAEAMTLCMAVRSRKQPKSAAFFVSEDCHPQTIEVVRTRAEPLGFEIIVGDHRNFDFHKPVFGALIQYPTTTGTVEDYRAFTKRAHDNDSLVVVAADILAICLLTPPGEFGADIAIGNTQRFGVPLGYGGPHAAYIATRDEYKRQVPGRIVGISVDADGNPAVRLALQTREQHIRRDRATSNICTAQVLLAVIASMYSVYHGPQGLRRIAERVHALTATLNAGLKRLGYDVPTGVFFDTLKIGLGKVDQTSLVSATKARKINLRLLDAHTVGVTLDDSVSREDLTDILDAFAEAAGKKTDFTLEACAESASAGFDDALTRKSEYLKHDVFNRYHSETEMMRYVHRLQGRDLSLTHSMIPLGSCTMKLNSTAEMMPVTWKEFGSIHPFVPLDQARGYQKLISQLEEMLMEVTGFEAVSLQPNAGSQGEYTGLLVIRKFHESHGDKHRNICLIPSSAHGTNPASAAMAGMKIVVVACDDNGNINVADLEKKAAEHQANLAALMVTYPSTHGVFEEQIVDICRIVHDHGGQVYLDGANMNAQIGLCKPGEYGADVCHLNLHKTFCIPHGGGGPGMGPIGVRAHLAPFLPSHPIVKTGGANPIGAISAAPWGSPGILPISWMYIRMMGAEGLKRATQVAILNANYVAKRLSEHFPVLYTGKNDLVAHECIFDLRQLKQTTGIEVEDVAKRLMDYGYHAPTISFPVAGTMMVEPTESESKEELDRFCDAMIAIHDEIREVEEGKADRDNNVVKNAPHTATQVSATEWNHPYTREKAAFPVQWLRGNKFWPAVSRINNVQGDRNLVCTCPPIEMYA